MQLPKQIRVVDVSPRDGLQSLDETYSTEIKLALVDLLVKAGLSTIEVTGFVRPEVIPQLADATELVERLEPVDGVTYRTLVPNKKGAELAAAAGVGEILGLITATDSYNKKNSNMTVAENLDHAAAIAQVARDHDIPMVMAIGMAMFCPYDGDVPPERVLGIVERLRAEGIDELYVATSVGLDGPGTVNDLVSRILDRWPDLRLGVHLHNTNGMALANALAAAEAGATFVEGAICGIGGGIRMPYGMAPYGNVATEDLVHMFHESGVETGVELDAILDAAKDVRELLELESISSYALSGGTKEAVLERGRVAPRY